jgi:hypothetical protein
VPSIFASPLSALRSVPHARWRRTHARPETAASIPAALPSALQPGTAR